MLAILSNIIIPIVVAGLTAATTYLFHRMQILSSEKAFIEFVLQSDAGVLGPQYVRNIGTNTAVNVKIYKVFVRDSDAYSIKGKIFFTGGDLSLQQSFGTMLTGERRELSLKPDSNSYEIFIVEYQNIAGETYQTMLKPTPGRGDHEFLYVPKRIRFKKNQFEGLFGENHILLPLHIFKVFNVNVNLFISESSVPI